MDGTPGGSRVTEGKKIIEVTDEEFEYLIKLRVELQRRQAAGEPVELPPEHQRGSDFAMGAVAGVAAYWLYKELLDDEEDEPTEVKDTSRRPPSKKSRRG
ncbi:MAG: hypothetical protein LN414_07700 [Candidatus Thermoplasmatota archaeon]|nr:hypothetical protein [Candidatus Thermoplasmatota archaeon]